MKLSTKSRYGLRAVVEIAKTYGSMPAKRRNIAAVQDISDSYLENILIVLKNCRIIETSRGVNGGYVLCKAPKEVSVLEVVSALEGPLDLVECVRSETACPKTHTCAAHTVWKELATTIDSVLGRITIQDLIEREGALTPSYSI